MREPARDPERHTMRAESRELTIMFCDIRDFTRVAETLSPEALRELGNRLCGVMTEAIHACRGTLDKQIGDAMMAFWGASLDDPLHAHRAVLAALDMATRPPVGFGIGLNTGLVCVGDMGSAVRRGYTVMGDAVNPASRVEGLTRLYGVEILVGDATREACGEAVPWIEVDRVRVKGRSQPVTLFTPVAEAATKRPGFADDYRLWQLALAAWRRQDWDDAAAFATLLGAQSPGTVFAALGSQLVTRVHDNGNRPMPPGWDGATAFESK